MFIPVIAAAAFALTFVFGSVHCDKKGIDTYKECVSVQKNMKADTQKGEHNYNK